MDLFLNKEGEPVPLEEWARLMSDPDYKFIEQEYVGPYWVSTVFLGVDYSFGYGSRPLLFETMVFNKGPEDHLGPDLECQRYSTEDEARAGHRGVVDEVRLFVDAMSIDLDTSEVEAHANEQDHHADDGRGNELVPEDGEQHPGSPVDQDLPGHPGPLPGGPSSDGPGGGLGEPEGCP